MEKAVLTVFGRHESEKIIEKSRFLTYSAHVESEAEARAFLSEVKALHPLATHCCYAFVADKAGNLQRFSDDGEPQGTAGIPILDVKLGAGGLVRAYSSCAAENLAAAEIRSLEMCVEYGIEVEYSEADAARKFISSQPCTLLSSDYGEGVTFRVAVKKSQAGRFDEKLTDCMQGRVKISVNGEYYNAFEA